MCSLGAGASFDARAGASGLIAWWQRWQQRFTFIPEQFHDKLVLIRIGNFIVVRLQ